MDEVCKLDVDGKVNSTKPTHGPFFSTLLSAHVRTRMATGLPVAIWAQVAQGSSTSESNAMILFRCLARVVGWPCGTRVEPIPFRCRRCGGVALGGQA
eukprot:837460-Amphidinium_carterae.1